MNMQLSIHILHMARRINMVVPPVETPDTDDIQKKLAIPCKYDFTPFVFDDFRDIIEELSEYKNIGIFKEIKINDKIIKCQVGVEIGYENYMKNLLKTPFKDRNYDIGIIEHIYSNLYIMFECGLKVYKYNELFERIFWGVICNAKIKYNTRIIGINSITTDAHRGVVNIYPLIDEYYAKPKITEIWLLRTIYFKETFEMLLIKLMNYIDANLKLDEDLMKIYNNHKKAIIARLIFSHGESNYYSILNNIDEFMKFMNPDFCTAGGYEFRCNIRDISPKGGSF